MYEIRMIDENPAASLPLTHLTAMPESGALYVMRENGADQCAAVVTLQNDRATLVGLGRADGAPEENIAVLLEWLYFKYGRSFPLLHAALTDASDAFLTANGFTRGADGAWTRPLSVGCHCKE